MNIQWVIIHELSKVSGRTGAKVKLSNSILDQQHEDVIELVTELNSRYKTKTENYGVFDPEEPTRFHAEFNTYHGGQTEPSFITFTKQVTQDLREKIDSNAPARGGFLIFARYDEYRPYVGVFLVRDTRGMHFKRNTTIDAFDVSRVEHIDFEKMAMACRINLDAFSTNESRYLSFINKKNDTLSQYFTSWISSTDMETNHADTQHLFDMLRGLPTPAGADGVVPDSTTFLSTVSRFINEQPQKIVSLKQLGTTFYGDEMTLLNYAEEQGLPINGEFKAHSQVMKKFTRVSASADRIDLAFPQEFYNDVVRINENNPNQIIIESEALADAVRQMVAN